MAITLTPVDDVGLSIYALTDLASAKAYIQETTSDNDDLIIQLINGVSSEIERITGVNFKARDYREWLNGRRQRQITLGHYPVQNSPRIAFGAANAMTVSFTTGSNIRATAGVYRDPEQPDAGGVKLETISSSGVSTITDLSFATYKSVSALVTAINAVSGWSATTLSNQPTGDLHPSAAQNTLGATANFMYPDQVDYTYSLKASSGLLRFDNLAGGLWAWWGSWGHELRMPGEWQHVLIQYRAGYETIPADVELITNQIVADKFYESQDGRGVTEIKVGAFLTRFDKSLIDDIRTQLAGYIDLSSLIGD